MPSILITGSGRRIGKGLATEFARHGWDVVIHYNQSEKSALETYEYIKSLGVKTFLVKADILSRQQISEMFERIVNEFGVPDVLVNNAGIFPRPVSLSEITENDWENVLGINLSGAFYCSQDFSKYAKDNARIINIGSLGGLEVWKQRIHYNVSKAGVIHLTKALAKELAPKITVNCVCPGAILIPEEPSENDFSLILSDRIPMKRYGTVNDIFDAVFFFSSATNYITGQVICVDGGYHELR